FLPPNNTQPNGPHPVPFVNGTVFPLRQAVIGQQGPVTISVVDYGNNGQNLTLPGDSVDLTINPGPVYVFHNVPTSAVAGQTFAPFTITLEDSNGPVVGYNRAISLTAALPSGGPGSGVFRSNSNSTYVMHDGSVTISDLSYAYSENIQIQLQDEFQ